MRKHLYLITEHPDEDLVGQIKVTESRLDMARKNQERVIQALSGEAIERGEITDEDRYEYKVVGLGYADFEDEAAYQLCLPATIKDKLAEIDPDHLRKAGVDPDEVLPDEMDYLNEYRTAPLSFPLHILNEIGEPLCGNLTADQESYLGREGYTHLPTVAEKRGEKEWVTFLGDLCGTCRNALLARSDDADLHAGWEERQAALADEPIPDPTP